MIDAITQERIVVHSEGEAGPYVMVAQEQLEAVTAALAERDVQFWADEDVISIDNEPPVAVINFGRGLDVRAIQRVLDGL